MGTNEKMCFIINCVLNKVFQCALNIYTTRTHTSFPPRIMQNNNKKFASHHSFVRVVCETVFISLNRKNRLTVNAEIEHHNSKKYQYTKAANMCYGQMLYIKYKLFWRRRRSRRKKTDRKYSWERVRVCVCGWEREYKKGEICILLI